MKRIRLLVVLTAVLAAWTGYIGFSEFDYPGSAKAETPGALHFFGVPSTSSKRERA